MRDGYMKIQIAFLGSVSINNLPTRLQNWLSHIDEFGHGYEINQASSEYVSKNPGLALALILRAIPFIKDNYRGELSRPYGASIRLIDSSDSLELIVLNREKNVPKKNTDDANLKRSFY